MRINHNIASLNTYRQLNTNSAQGAKSLEKLSSGLRINRAGDDAAGLAISEKMRGQIRGLDQASRNAQDSISLIQTAEGALNESHSILQRMRELSVQSSNATNTDDDRASIQKEVSQLKSEIDRIGNNTEFNTKKLINGDLSGSSVGGTGTALGAATSGVLLANDFDPSCTTSVNSTQNFQINIDGHVLCLTGIGKAAGTDQFSFFNCLKTQVTCAVGQWNALAANADDQITMPTFEITDVKCVTSMDFKITSGTTGSGSKIELRAMEDGAHKCALDSVKDIAATLVCSASSTAGTDGKLTAITACNLNTIDDACSKLSMTFNGNAIDVSLLCVGAATFAANGTVQNVANKLENDINTALNNYKCLTGKDMGQVCVNAKDGKLVITSSKADTVSFEIASDTTCNAARLGLDSVTSSTGGGLTFQIGANKGQDLNLAISDMRSSALGVGDIDVSTQAGATNGIEAIDNAIKTVSSERSKLGAYQNRLEHTINNLGTSSENLTAAESRVRDVDMAKEMMEFQKNNILSQAAQAMLAQANQQPQGVLQLLR